MPFTLLNIRVSATKARFMAKHLFCNVDLIMSIQLLKGSMIIGRCLFSSFYRRSFLWCAIGNSLAFLTSNPPSPWMYIESLGRWGASIGGTKRNIGGLRFTFGGWPMPVVLSCEIVVRSVMHYRQTHMMYLASQLQLQFSCCCCLGNTRKQDL